MNQKYVEQTPEGLSYHLFFAPPNFKFENLGLTKLQSKVKTFQNFKIETWIIGESHLFTVTLPDGQRLVEIFACVKLNLELNTLVVINAAELFEKMIFDFEMRKCNYHLEVNKHDIGSGEIENDGCAIYLEQSFPTKKPNGIVPKTQVAIWTSDKRILFQSLHSYPNCGSAVNTCTILEL